MTERYRKIIRIRRAAAVLYVVIGLLLLAALFAGRTPGYMRPFFAGTCFAMIANGIVNFYRKNKLLRDEKGLEKKSVIEFDERNTEVMRRAWAMAYEVLLVIGWAAMIVAGFLNETVCYTLLASLCVGLATGFVCYVIVWKML